MMIRSQHARLAACMAVLSFLPVMAVPTAQAQYNNRQGNFYNGAYNGGRGGPYDQGRGGRYDDHRRHDQGGIGPGKGALIGTAGGAALGAIFGGGLKGALIGGAAGAGIGAIAGQVNQNHRDDRHHHRY
ncbi:MAG: hypothetical protein PW735_02685 [Acidobacteriaceae bacterium]|nr:hypothetical protein [Acidobacteriaceae bacterium]